MNIFLMYLGPSNIMGKHNKIVFKPNIQKKSKLRDRGLFDQTVSSKKLIKFYQEKLEKIRKISWKLGR